MIFKKLFKSLSIPKWKNQNVDIRLKAIEELATDKDKNKSTLHELAFNDSSDKVRQLALQQLNDFSVWWQASKTDKSERLNKLAQENVRKGLLGTADFVVDDKTKVQFIEQCNKTHLLEELALKDQNEQTRLSLLTRLNKANLLVQTIQDSSTSVWLKTEVIGKLEELPMLEKLLKKADDTLKPILVSKIDAMKAIIEKPRQLRKDVGLMLAKLNALKDKVDIEDIEQKQAQLTLEWDTLKTSFELLAEDESKALQAKYQKITTSLTNITAPLKEQWQQRQAVAADLVEKASNKAIVEQQLQAIQAQLSKAFTEHDELAGEEQQESLKATGQQLQQLNLAQQDKNVFAKQIEQCYQKIGRMPQITLCVAEATRLLSMLSSMTVPTSIDELDDVLPAYKQWQHQWRDNQGKVDLVFPETISASYEQLTNQWKTATKPLIKAQDELFSQVRKALSDLKQMLSSGKYLRAFGLFKKVNSLHAQLNERQVDKLSRDFDNVKAKVEEMADWQEYIATPRKQQLLDEMQGLAQTPLQSPQEQAKKVRFVRQTWNSLGHASDDIDSELNQQFNDACEKAFEVCRAFYAEQDLNRASNLKIKQDICADLQSAAQLLTQTPVPWQTVESVISRVRKEWKSSGEVDRDNVTKVNEQYYALLEPLQSALRNYQEENASLKQGLLTSAQDLLQQADVFDAVGQLKDIQQKWKTIGFAGRKNDNQLWRVFREVNDQVFAKRDEEKNQQKTQSQQQMITLTEQLNDIEGQILNTPQLSVLAKSSVALNDLIAGLSDNPKHVQSKIAQQAKKIESLINTRKEELQQQTDKAKYHTLFEQFEQLSISGELDSQIESSSAWDSILSALPQIGEASLRYDLTIQLEMVCGVESQVKDSQRRMSLQMNLLSSKMNGDQVVAQDELLKQWICVGRLGKDEQEVLGRVKALYL